MNSLKLTIPIALLLAACGSDERTPRKTYTEGDTGSSSQDAGGSDTSTADMGAPGELTCAQFADPNFCWNVARAEAYACAGDFGTGMMTDGDTACVSGDVRVDFDAALSQDTVIDDDITGLQVSKGGEQCAALEDTDTSFVLTTVSGAVHIDFVGLSSYAVTCPDGDVWETTNVQGLLSCVDADGFTTLPGTSKSSIGSEFGFALLPGSDNLFQCRF